MHESPRSRLVAYGAALSAMAVGLVVRWHLHSLLGERALYSTSFPAVMIAAYFGGFWAGLVVTIVAAIATNYFLVEPYFALQFKDTGDVVAVCLFVLTGTIISALCESLHRARRRIVADERRRAEEAISEAKERFRFLVQNSSDIISLFDAEGTVLFQSPSIERLLGHKPQDRVGRNVFRDPIVHPDDLVRKRVFFDTMLSRPGAPVTAEFRLRHADGSWRDIEAIGQNFLHDPSVAGIVTSYRDITERKRAEAALRESDERMRQLVSLMPAAMYTCDAEGRITFYNRRAAELWGREPRLGMDDERFCGSLRLWQMDGSPLPHDQTPVAACIRDGRSTRNTEIVIEQPDGARVIVSVKIEALYNHEGERAGAINVFEDITERKRAEEAIRRQAELLRLSYDAIVVWRLDGAIESWSRGAEELYGFAEAEALGHITHELLRTVHPVPWPEIEAKLRAGGSWEGELRHRTKDGHEVIVSTRHQLVRDADGVWRVLESNRDVTERKRAEGELRRAKEAAESANRAKDDFLANVSHEIRTPMNAILGMTELVLDTPLADDQRQSLKTVKSAADNLLGIINDLLDFSKIEAGKLELDAGEFSLRAAVGDTLRALAMRAHRKGLELACTVQPEVPDALIGDAGRLRQVLLNLVGNAIKFTGNGEVVVEVDVVAEPAPADNVSLRFTVRDTGIGIPREKQSSIFRAFEQEDTSTTRKYGGTGLGLTISAQLVALMGGNISVQSELGRGSTFSFTARFGRQLHEPVNVATAPPVLLRDLRVLVVDDNATNRHIMEQWLREWQMQPTSVGDGMAAMDALWHGVAVGKPHALLLLDARMPDTDGLTLAAKIRERAELSGSRIILLTSGDRPGDLARFRELRVDGHLLKPVQQDELLETIYSIMSRTNGNGSASTRPSPSADSAQATLPAVSPLRVLVAEDSEFNAQLMEKLLAKRGHKVRLVSNGREALAVATPADFDLLLLDMHMPELDGVQVIRAIREHEQGTGSHLPVIALTARSRKEDRELCLAAGMDGFLSKPIRVDDLWSTIDRVLAEFPSANRGRARLLNPQVLLAACGGDAAILRSICQGFRAALPAQLSAIRDALATEDAPGLRDSAHKLCGMVAAFSTVAGSMASEIEDYAARGQTERARPIVHQLDSVSQELMRLVTDDLTIESLRHEEGMTQDEPRPT